MDHVFCAHFARNLSGPYFNFGSFNGLPEIKKLLTGTVIDIV